MKISTTTFITWGCGVLSVVGFVYVITIGIGFHGENQTLLADGLHSAREKADRAQERIDTMLGRAADAVDGVAGNLLKPGQTDELYLLGALRNLLYSNSGFVEVGVAFAPFTHDRQIRLYGLSYVVDDDGMHFRDLDTNQDYTKPGADWYHRPLSGMAVWLDPRHDDARQRTVVTYAAPLFNPAAVTEPVGVIYATYALGGIQRVLDAMELGENGYGFLLSSARRFFLHPNKDYVDARLSMAEFQTKLSKPSAEAIEAALREASVTARFTGPNTGSESQIFFRQVPVVSWVLGVVVIDKDVLMPSTAARPTLIRMVLVLALSVVLLVVALSGALKGSTSGFWVVSSVFALCCILVTGFVLWLEIGESPRDGDDSLRITNRNMLNRFMSDQRRRTLEQSDEVPLFIPTGIYVQSIAFESGNDVRLTGYLWQRYSAGVHDEVERGFVMPGSKSFHTDDPDTTMNGGTEVVRWNFNATLHQDLDYTGYPFGSEAVRIQLWHKEFTRNVILVPDLEAYKLIHPAAGPALLEDLRLAGWNIGDSFFSYRLKSYGTSFGLVHFAGLSDFPELFFNIEIEKQITGPFVSNILPIIVVNILLFGILFLATREGSQKGLLGFTLDVIIACAAFFLVVIFSHISLRRGLAAPDIFYLEYYYFVTYVLILFVTINYVHFAKTPIPLLRYRDNLIAKLIYWPVGSLAVLVVTLLQFY